MVAEKKIIKRLKPGMDTAPQKTSKSKMKIKSKSRRSKKAKS